MIYGGEYATHADSTIELMGMLPSNLAELNAEPPEKIALRR